MANTNIQEYKDIQLTLESANGDRKITFGSATGKPQGISIEYDRLSTPKIFEITPVGMYFNDGTSNFTTGLGRLCAVQQAFQAVELPPDATTLNLNKRALLNDPAVPATNISIDGSIPSITITDGTNTNTITATSGGGVGTYDQVLNV